MGEVQCAVLGESALSDADLGGQATDEIERSCSRVAAEVLQMLGLKKLVMFNGMGERLGVM